LNQVAFTSENLKQFAVELGLDSEAFNTCLDSDRYRDVVLADTEMAQNFGIPGTPAFLINDAGLQGAQPFDAFQQIIEAELADQSAP
jgi:predicted DsbA family dithiol-disulfide isomerase